MAELHDFFKSVTAAGGEGVVARNEGRMLKLKAIADFEAVVIGYSDDRNSLLCRREGSGGAEFSLTYNGHRERPPVGSLITVEALGFFPSGKPREARFKGIRQDKAPLGSADDPIVL